LKGIGHLLAANARMFFRVRQEIFWVFFLPVFLLVLLGPMLKNMAGVGSLRPEDVDFPVGIVDNDNTVASREFVVKLKEAGEFTVAEFDEDEGLEQARLSAQRLVVIFPAGFEQALQRSEATITVITDARALPLTGMAFSILREKIDAILSEYTPAKAPPVVFVNQRVKSIDEFTDYVDFLVPGIISMAVMISCIFSLSPTIVRLREQGVMRRLWVTPLGKASFLASHVLFRMLIAVAQALLLIAVAFTLLDTHLELPLLPVLVFVVLGNLNGTAISFTIAGFAKTPEVASTIANVVSIPMLFLCGVFLPMEIMPPKFLPLLKLLPLTHLSDGLRRLMGLDWTFAALWKSELALLAYLVVFFAISLRIFKWDKSTAE
jgi:ABC-2 type transport system permease protein